MPRQPRYFVPGIPQHVIARGIDRQAVFFQPRDCRAYLDALGEASESHGCAIHAYVLMTNHVHLLVTPGSERSLPLLMQAMGRNYVQRLNRRYRRTGTLWEGRYKASPVQDDLYLLTCHRYIEENPVRGGMVKYPIMYPFSSYAHNALGKPDLLIKPHPVYLQLAADAGCRRLAYRALFRETLTEGALSDIRDTTNACLVLGNDRFKDQIEAMLGRSVRPGKRGRPRKPSLRKSE
jgi:putative transposase